MRSLSACALLLLGGCSTIYDLVGGTENGPQPFGGVRTWPEAFSETFGIPPASDFIKEYFLSIYLWEFIIDAIPSYRGGLRPPPRHATLRDLPELTL